MNDRFLFEEMPDHTRVRSIGPFTVDGIEYDRMGQHGVFCHRQMIQLLDDPPDPYHDDAAIMIHSEPPTEQELHNYVRYNHLPSI